MLTEDNWFEVMGDRPTTRAVGDRREDRRRSWPRSGIDTVDQLAHSDARVLAAEIGPTMGPWFHRLGRGVDTSPVDATPWVPRAHGREETFQQDLDDWADVEARPRADPPGGRGHRPRGPARRPGSG